MIKDVPIHLRAKMYHGIFNINQLEGTIEVDGVRTKFSTGRISGTGLFQFTRLRRAFYHKKFPYFGIGARTNPSTGSITHTCSVYLSKDLSKLFGSTEAVRKAYGETAFFRAPKDLKVRFESH